MDTKMQLQRNATVLNADGELVGYLNRVVLNPETKVIAQIVIRNGTLLSKDERVVPIAFVTETTENEIVLHEEAKDLEAFSLFEEKLSVDADDYMDVPPPARDIPIGSPGFPVSPGFDRPQHTAPGQEMIPPDKQNIRQGTVALKEGANVVALEGEYVGDVERVIADSELKQATHLLVSNGMLLKEAKLIPIDWVMAFGQEKIRLQVKKDAVEALEDVSVGG
jgi:uncharacterized protein YrrD